MEMLGVISFVYLLIILIIIGMGIYGFVLFVKFTKRGIKAFDIYISEKSNNKL